VFDKETGMFIFDEY